MDNGNLKWIPVKVVERMMYDGRSLKQEITVPFCPESQLSGIGYTDFIPAVWYKRHVHMSKDWIEQRVLLHFGAVDYATEVWVNGQRVGHHKGGYTAFVLDVTDYAKVMEVDLPLLKLQ